MSWEVPEGRHYLAGPSRWWYWERRGATAGEAGQTKPEQGNYMSQHETDYGASGSDGGGSQYGGYGRYSGYGSDGEYDAQAGPDDGYPGRTATKVAAAYAAGYGGGHGGTPVVTFENVSKHYGRLRAVEGLSLDLRAGETVALLGPNGAGKSTSLDMLLALRKPTSGRIRMFGDDPYHAVKSGRVGAMLQSGGLMPEVTVRDLVELVTKLHPNPEPVATTLKRAGITQFADQRVDRLSGGQTQRVRFALAICGKSELIVLDEPTAAMDVETRRLFWNSMKAEVAAGRTLLFATHYLEEADQAADRILVINRGRLLADGTPAEIKARAGAKRLSFRLDQVDEPFLLGLPGLVNLEVRHDVVQIQSSDSDATLYAILDAGYRPREIEVSSLGLEQAFLAITAEDDATNGHPAGETN
jgi:ABC-2 type transport system ATP-binding protein